MQQSNLNIIFGRNSIYSTGPLKPFVSLSVSPFVGLSVCPSVRLSVCPLVRHIFKFHDFGDTLSAANFF